jgi:hypothetical protein
MDKKDYDFVAYSVGFFYASVCTSLPVEKAEERLNQEYPTGIKTDWHLSKDEYFAPEEGKDKKPNGCPCEDHPETHKHYLFCC